jgi:hypothetical protein
MKFSNHILHRTIKVVVSPQVEKGEAYNPRAQCFVLDGSPEGYDTSLESRTHAAESCFESLNLALNL